MLEQTWWLWPTSRKVRSEQDWSATASAAAPTSPTPASLRSRWASAVQTVRPAPSVCVPLHPSRVLPRSRCRMPGHRLRKAARDCADASLIAFLRRLRCVTLVHRISSSLAIAVTSSSSRQFPPASSRTCVSARHRTVYLSVDGEHATEIEVLQARAQPQHGGQHPRCSAQGAARHIQVP